MERNVVQIQAAVSGEAAFCDDTGESKLLTSWKTSLLQCSIIQVQFVIIYTSIAIFQGADKNQDFSEVMADPDFLQRVLSTLPGVDTSSDAIQNVMSNLTQQDVNMEDDSDDKKKSDKK